MDSSISRAEYEEHNKRMEDGHHRINRCIALLEETTKQIGQIAASTEKIAINMENMLEEQRELGNKLDAQGDRIAAMEKGPGDTWQRIKNKALDTGMGLVFGAFVTGAVLGCVAAGSVSLENIVYGAVTGLASTGLHQMFKQLINKAE